MACTEPGAPNSHLLAEAPAIHVPAFANVRDSAPERSPHSNGPDTPPANTSMSPVFELTCTLQPVTASLLYGKRAMPTVSARIARGRANMAALTRVTTGEVTAA